MLNDDDLRRQLDAASKWALWFTAVFAMLFVVSIMVELFV